MSFEIHSSEFHPTRPVLRAPSRSSTPPDHEIHPEKILDLKKAKPPLKARIRRLPRKCLEFFRDSQSMLLLVEFFGIAGSALALAGSGTAKYVPYLSIASSPFYLYHALAAAKARTEMMLTAFKVNQVTDAIFWGIRALDSAGTALSDIVKPFAGGVTIAGLTTLTTVGLIFTTIIPVILIVFGAIGGLSCGWAMIRTEKTLKEFNRKYRNHPLGEMLDYLHGPKATGNDAKDALDKKNFTENYFSNNSRGEAIQKRIDALVEEHGTDAIAGLVQPILESILKEQQHFPEMEGVIHLIGDVQVLFGNLLLQKPSVNELLSVYERFFTLVENTDFPQEVTEDLRSHHEKLKADGAEVVKVARNDLHRHLVIQATLILAALITLAAGMMFLLTPHAAHIALILALSSCAIKTLYISMDKAISEEYHRKLQHYLAKKI